MTVESDACEIRDAFVEMMEAVSNGFSFWAESDAEVDFEEKRRSGIALW